MKGPEHNDVTGLRVIFLPCAGGAGLNQRDDEKPDAKVAPGEGQSVRKSKGREWPASSVGDL
jgi:hypothetical protein